MAESGVTCMSEPAETFGARIGRYAEPGGLVFSVSEAKASTCDR